MTIELRHPLRPSLLSINVQGFKLRERLHQRGRLGSESLNAPEQLVVMSYSVIVQPVALSEDLAVQSYVDEGQDGRSDERV